MSTHSPIVGLSNKQCMAVRGTEFNVQHQPCQLKLTLLTLLACLSINFLSPGGLGVAASVHGFRKTQSNPEHSLREFWNSPSGHKIFSMALCPTVYVTAEAQSV